jgi:hypothetical protein
MEHVPLLNWEQEKRGSFEFLPNKTQKKKQYFKNKTTEEMVQDYFFNFALK